ncbi:MAG TPA: F0F1 ATP synthase subunit B, partial [Myxococcales bacterium]|nr:F0F1 ATP synthase subunit B [Myxococcales bacterium]
MELSPTTLIFETINFLVLVFVLWRILYRPLRASIEAR